MCVCVCMCGVCVVWCVCMCGVCVCVCVVCVCALYSSFYDNGSDMKCICVMLKYWECSEWWLGRMWKTEIMDCDNNQWFGRVTEEVHIQQWSACRCPEHSNIPSPRWTFWVLQLYQLSLLDDIKMELRHEVPWMNLMSVVRNRDQCRFLWIIYEVLGCTEYVYTYI